MKIRTPEDITPEQAPHLEGREIIVHPAGLAKRSAAQKWGVRPLPKRFRRIKRELLITGTGRSGTTHLSHLMKHYEIPVEHEAVGRAGTSSHYFHTDSDWYPMQPWDRRGRKIHVGERLSDFEFKRVVLVVRAPLPCIGSMMGIFQVIDHEFLIDNGMMPTGRLSKLERCMWNYYAVNTKILAQKPDAVFHLEDLKRNWKKIAPLLGIGNPGAYPEDVGGHNRSSGFRRRVELTWEDLEKTNAALTSDIKKLARKLKY